MSTVEVESDGKRYRLRRALAGQAHAAFLAAGVRPPQVVTLLPPQPVPVASEEAAV